MKIFGYNIQLSKNNGKNQTQTITSGNTTRRARNVIRKQIKREVSFQIADIKTALQLVHNIDTPDRQKLLQIYDYIIKDGHLISQIRNAKFEVISEPYMLYSNNTPNEAATAIIQKRWFNKFIEYIFEAELYGYSVVEVDNIDVKEGSIGYLISFPRQHISIELQRILIDGTANGAYIEYANIIDDLDLVEFFVSRDNVGILLECAYNVIWKYYARSDWSRANEKVGIPLIAIEANTNNETELDRLENVAANFGADGYSVTQQGDKVTLVERKNENFHNTFKDMIALCDEQVSKILNGQTSSSDQKAFVGAAQVHERTMATFTQARLQFIADEVNEKLLPYLIKKGFPLQGLKFDYPQLIRTREGKLNPPQIQTIQEPTNPTEPITKDKKAKSKN